MRDDQEMPSPEPAARSSTEAERDYYRLVAERLGRKSLTDAQDSSRLIHRLRDKEEELRRRHEVLERMIAERTAALVHSNTELRDSTARYDELVRRIPNGVYILRVHADSSVRFEYLSPRACEILGVDADAVMGDALQAIALVHADDRDRLERLSREMTRRRAAFRWEGRFVVRGEIRWIRLESEPTVSTEGDVRWSGVLSDVSERRLTESKLRESEELYRLLNQVAPHAVTVSTLDGVMTNVNPRALQLFGVDRESDAQGRNVFEFVAPGSVPVAMAALDEVMRTGFVTNVELQLRRIDGTEFPGEVNGSLLHDQDGRPRLLVISATDATARRQAEAERLRLQKFEAIGTLAGGIAHDFNNLLQAVFGYVSLAKVELADSRRAESFLDQAEQAMSQAVNLTSQLLTFARGGAPRKAPLALRRTIENATRFALSGSASTCALDVAPDLSAVEADEGQIGQVIQNVVLNASQAMDLAGAVLVSAQDVELQPSEVSALPEGGRFVRIRIRDRGEGIPAEHLPRLFDPYFTTKPGGSGLGLATSYSIAKRHGGAITVASTPSVGSIFDIYLPAASARPQPDEPGASLGVPARFARVLVMDDEELVRDVAGKMLRTLGYDVVCVANGEQAIDAVQAAIECGRPLDVVVLDLTVKGGMGGEESVPAIRQISPGVKAVVSSGYSERSVLSDFRAHGFDACLNKPYTLAALKQTIAALLDAEGPRPEESFSA
jgi:two-component system, cell cycle sensor histidine kinase and response regulator CckA